MYTLSQFQELIGLEFVHEKFSDCFADATAEYELSGVPFLVDSFILNILNKYPFLTEKREFVMRELVRVRESDIHARYSFILYKMLCKNQGSERITLPELPKGKCVEDRVDYEMAAYFSLLAFAPKMIEYYEGRGLPKQIITDTLEDAFQLTVKLRNITHDRDGFDDKTYFSWNQLYTNYSIIRVGVLNFELDARFGKKAEVFCDGQGNYKIYPKDTPVAKGGIVAGSAGYPDTEFVAALTETDDDYIGYPINTSTARIGCARESIPKSKWKRVLSFGDRVIGVHIPTASPITRENCTAAYLECLDTVKKYFPEYNTQIIYCQSWLLDPQLQDFLPKSSNIANFGSQYLRFPVLSQGNAVFSFLFRKPYNSYEELPERTTLERAVKAHYISGKYVYEAGGVIFSDMLCQK